MAAGGEPFAAARGGLKVRVRVIPRAGREGIEGWVDLPGAGPAVRAAVTAPAEGGKANAALLKLLARTWRLPKSSLSLAAGKTGRTKTVLIAGDPVELRVRLGAWWRMLEARK